MNIKDKMVEEYKFLRNEHIKKSRTELYYEEVLLRRIYDEGIRNLFPKTGKLLKSRYDNPTSYEEENIPCHINDIVWLSRYFQIKNNLMDIPLKNIIIFFEGSVEFEEERKEYLNRLVTWRIKSLIYQNNKLEKNQSTNEIINSPDYDIKFRDMIVDKLETLKIPIEIIESGIEQNEDLWKNQILEKTFENQIKNGYILVEPEILDEYKNIWLKMKKFQYGIIHLPYTKNNSKEYSEINITDEKFKEYKEYLKNNNLYFTKQESKKHQKNK